MTRQDDETLSSLSNEPVILTGLAGTDKKRNKKGPTVVDWQGSE